MIKAIFFDAAGILYTRGGHTEKFALDLLQDEGFSTELSSDQMAIQMNLRSQANQGVVGHDVYWDQFLLMRGVNDPQQRKEFATRIINYSNDILPIPGAREALTILKQRGFLLGIITDTMYPVEWKMRRLEKAGVAEFIDIVACSTDLGAHKPDPAVYAYAIQQAKLTQNETVFVGHLGVELEGAQKAGMVTVAIDNDPDARADYYCKSLIDMLNIPPLQQNSLQPA
jgi:HAD superfamily hydrolase (TIGR01509 family)